MNMHTPGPWEVAHKRTIFPVGERALSIAVVEQHRKECEANACLIAASPNMLAALKEFVRETRAYASPECDECSIVGPLLRMADAAIAKAEGQSK